MDIATNFFENEKAQFDINLAPCAILGLMVAAAFLLVGIIVLQGIVNGAEGEVDEGGKFYDVLDDIKNSIDSSINLSTLLIDNIGVVILILLIMAIMAFVSGGTIIWMRWR